METYLHRFILAQVKTFLRLLNADQLLALTCELDVLIAGLVRLVRNRAAELGLDPTDTPAQTFYRSKRQIRNLLKKT